MEILVTKNAITERWREYSNEFFNVKMDKGEQTANFQSAELFVEESRGNQNTQEQYGARC